MVGPSLPTTKLTIKFLCSYGGKILPRQTDGKLRYHGGETRVLAVDRSISFAELLLKLGELCGTSVSYVRCQLPTEDLDALVSITSDEDLANLIEEYDRAASPPSSLKIRAFLSLPKSTSSSSSSSSKKQTTSSSSSSSSSPPQSSFASSSSPNLSSYYTTTTKATRLSIPATDPCHHHYQPPLPLCFGKSSARKMINHHHGYYAPGHIYLIHNGNHWQ